MKIIIILFLLAIIISLFSGLFFMLKDESKSHRTVNALTWRVGLQLALIVVLIVAFFMGWLRPHDIHKPRPANIEGPTLDTESQ